MANRFYIRKFFNKPGYHSTGFIYAYVSKTTKRNNYIHDTLTIGDCSRQVTLDFDHGSEKDRENSLYKLDMLIGAFQGFKDALVAEYALMEEREAKRKAELEAELEKEDYEAPEPYVYSPHVTEATLKEFLTSDEFLDTLRNRITSADN